MDDAMITAMFGALAAIFGLATTYMRGKQKEAYDQGDIILSKFEQAVKALSVIAAVYAPLAPIAKEAAEAYKALKAAWDDPEVSTAEFMALCEDLADLVKAVEALANGFQKV